MYRLDSKIFSRKLDIELQKAGKEIEKKLSSHIKVNAYPKAIVKTMSEIEGNFLKVIVYLTGSKAYYVAFVEHGTGEYMPDWWKPYASLYGAATEIYPRYERGYYFSKKDKQFKKYRYAKGSEYDITARGKGLGWTALGGKQYEGADVLNINGKFVVHAKGQKGKHKFKDAFENYEKINNISQILNIYINNALSKSLRKI